jgi:hypothetical protein
VAVAGTGVGVNVAVGGTGVGVLVRVAVGVNVAVGGSGVNVGVAADWPLLPPRQSIDRRTVGLQVDISVASV